MRLIREGSRTFEFGAGGTLIPSVESEVRSDRGDAETGTGLEVGARIRHAGEGVSVKGAAARAPIAHADRNLKEWGASGAIRIDPGTSGLGISLMPAPAWGMTSSGVERLWSLRDTNGLAANDDFEAERLFNAEIGDGLAFPCNLDVLTPFAGLGLSNESERLWLLGLRWKFAPEPACLPSYIRSPADRIAAAHGLVAG